MQTLEQKIDILARTALFGSLHEHALEQVAGICLSRPLDKKQMLFNEGDAGTAVFVLVTGRVQLYKTAPDGRRIVIKVVKPGEIFAEVVLFESNRYPVTAIALTAGLVFAIPRHQFSCLLNDNGFRGDFLGSLMTKLRFLTDQIQYLSSHDVEDRLFLFLEEQHGQSEKMTVTISKKDVAAAIGATPETLSRLLLRLKGENKLEWEGKTVSVAKSVWQSRQNDS